MRHTGVGGPALSLTRVWLWLLWQLNNSHHTPHPSPQPPAKCPCPHPGTCERVKGASETWLNSGFGDGKFSWIICVGPTCNHRASQSPRGLDEEEGDVTRDRGRKAKVRGRVRTASGSREAQDNEFPRPTRESRPSWDLDLGRGKPSWAAGLWNRERGMGTDFCH